MVCGGWVYFGMMLVTLGLIFCCLNLPESKNVERASSTDKMHFRRRRSLSWHHQSSQHHNAILSRDNSARLVTDRITDVLQHPRVMELCNRPQEGATSDEGSDISGFKLNKVLVVVSPGQTMSTNRVSHLSSPRVDCDFQTYAKYSSVGKIQTFPEVVNIYKNVQMNKGRFKIFSMMPSRSFCDEGQLTPLGAMQQILIGEQLSKAYFKKLRILRKISRDSFLAAKSIPEELAYQSASAFLHGFLNEKQFSQMYVEKSVYNFCKESRSTICSCAKADFLKLQISKSVEKGYLLFKDEPVQDDEINDLLGFERGDISPKQIISLLSGWLCDQSSLPCRGNNCPNLTTANLNLLFESADSHIEAVSNNDIFANFVKLHTRSFLSDVFHWLQSSEGEFLLYSAGESFLSFLVTALDIEQSRVLPLGSRLVFEVYSPASPRQQNKARLRVLLNGKDVTHKVGLCSKSEGQLCELEKAYRIFESQSFNGRSYDEECRSN
ncbi:2-phosphoxylose phosphatase 1-like [Gigantopelta aegis]|uniref:2-phosphoxylose phosphatase 1-like n=1 Tax=Gigantopelta aegis TaxID=1735272 RepID=UPI001B88CD10|nr:2-phosphoxylose phosphatase 1-like [Gigantopelta aegis]